MRYSAPEKLEIIRLVEESHLSARRTLARLGIPRTTFYRWYDRYLQRGEAGLQDQSPKPKHVWNRVPDEVKRKVVDFALKETELSPRELAVTFTDQERYFVSESTVYRTLKAHDLITRVSDLLCMSKLAHASSTKEHDDHDDFQRSAGRAAERH
jgi:putative transposase